MCCRLYNHSKDFCCFNFIVQADAFNQHYLLFETLSQNHGLRVLLRLLARSLPSACLSELFGCLMNVAADVGGDEIESEDDDNDNDNDTDNDDDDDDVVCNNSKHIQLPTSLRST
jgi:hypothetical protein